MTRRLSTILAVLAAANGLVFASISAKAATAEICNKAPFPVLVTYAHLSQESAKWEKQGWYRTLPGRCMTTKHNDSDYFYYFAEAEARDIVAKHLNQGDSIWSGRNEEHAVSLCVSNEAFKKFADDCQSSNREVIFARRNNGQTLNLTCSNCGLEIDELEEAGIAYRRFQGQIRYGRSISSDPIGVPFRVGIEVESDAHGPFITKVYSGLPAEHVLRPGDRIMMIDGQAVRSVFDLVFLLQEFGYRSNPSKRQVSIGFARYTPAPNYYETDLPVLYYRSLDDKINISEGDAAVLGLVDGVVFNTSPYLRCIGKFLYNEFNDIPKHLRQKGCVGKLRSERARANELHESMAVFDFVGSLTSPRLLLKLGAKSARRYTARRVTIAMADEALQGAISEVGWVGNLREIQAPSLLKTMGIGAVAGGVVGFVAR